MKTKYEIKKMSTGSYRIVYLVDGFLMYAGGKHSRRYCFSTLETAQAEMKSLMDLDDRLEAIEKDSV